MVTVWMTEKDFELYKDGYVANGWNLMNLSRGAIIQMLFDMERVAITSIYKNDGFIEFEII